MRSHSIRTTLLGTASALALALGANQAAAAPVGGVDRRWGRTGRRSDPIVLAQASAGGGAGRSSVAIPGATRAVVQECAAAAPTAIPG